VTYDGRGLRFGTVAEQYDLYRPPPPREVEAIFGDLRGSAVLEVGAGTGKWTRLLLELGQRSRSWNRTTTCARCSCAEVPRRTP